MPSSEILAFVIALKEPYGLVADLFTAEGVQTFRRFVTEAADLVSSLGGSISGEHGDGQARGELLGHMFSAGMLDVFREFKHLWDPETAVRHCHRIAKPGGVCISTCRLGEANGPWSSLHSDWVFESEGRYGRPQEEL